MFFKRVCFLSILVMSDTLRTMDHSPPSSSVHGIFQAKILEQVAISSSRIFLTQGWNLSLLHLLHWQAGSLPLSHLGSQIYFKKY